MDCFWAERIRNLLCYWHRRCTTEKCAAVAVATDLMRSTERVMNLLLLLVILLLLFGGGGFYLGGPAIGGGLGGIILIILIVMLVSGKRF